MQLEILRFGHPALTKVCPPVQKTDIRFVKWLSPQMWWSAAKDEMQGVGLAANQVGVNLRFFVLDPEIKDIDGASLSEDMIIVNPRILYTDGIEFDKEGCLSCRGFTVSVKRPAQVRVQYLDSDWVMRETQLDGLAARVFQHELDHLDGLFHVDRAKKEFRKKSSTQRILRKNIAVSKQQILEVGDYEAMLRGRFLAADAPPEELQDERSAY